MDYRPQWGNDGEVPNRTLLAKPRVIASPEAGDEVAGLQSVRPTNRAREPRLRGGSSVAGALYAPAGLDLDSSQPVAAKNVDARQVIHPYLLRLSSYNCLLYSKSSL
jgi:hypothetical protein